MTSKQMFDRRLAEMHDSKKTPAAEIDAACITMERLRTAISICHSAAGESIDPVLLAAVLAELGAEARSGHGTRLRE